MTPSFKAALRKDGEAFMMARGSWRSGWQPVADLPRWISLYTHLRDRKGVPANAKAKTEATPGPYYAIYAPAVEALVAVHAQAKAQQGAA